MKQAFNPYLPSYEYVPDGEPRIFNNRLYVYGSHDRFNGPGFCLNDYVCYSAPLDDLSDWTYHGVIWKQSQDPKYKANSKIGSMNAPDCIQGPDGRYYLYYQMGAQFYTSVAVSTSPEGPFEYYGTICMPDGKTFGGKRKQPFGFDPSIFIDDDGKIYLYIGFSPLGAFKFLMQLNGMKVDGAYGVELESDMKTIKPNTIKKILPGECVAKGTGFDGHGFFEASSMRKYNGKYYFVYSSIRSNELCYATSDSPLGTFTYGGTIVSITDEGYLGNKEQLNSHGNTHGGLVEVNGQMYIFYHRQTNKQKCARQGCAEKVYFNEDGSIPQVEITSCGLNNGPLVGQGTYEARIACNLASKVGPMPHLKTFEKDEEKVYPFFTQEGEDREDNPNQYIANMKDGSWCAFKYFDLRFINNIVVNVKGTAKGELVVSLGRDENVIGVIPIEAKEKYLSFKCDVNLEINKTSALYFTYKGNGYLDFKDFTLE